MSVEIVISLPDDLAEEFADRAEMEDRTVELQLLRVVKEYCGRPIFRPVRMPSVPVELPVAVRREDEKIARRKRAKASS